MGFEVGRTASNSIELEHSKKRGDNRSKTINSLTSVQEYLYFQAFYPLRLALPKIRRERVKLAKLANFKPAKTLRKKELCQLGQPFSRMQIERNRLLDEIVGKRWRSQSNSREVW
jgi:hypothetical protein